VEDSCLKHGSNEAKTASGISIFILEELGDARLRCAQLKKYIDEAVNFINKSEYRDHFFEVASHLIYGIPDTLLRMDKALSAAALAASKLDYEEIKEELRPEKVEELEKALEEVRVRRVQKQSKKAYVNNGQIIDKAQEAFKTIVLPRLQHETKEALDQAVTDAMLEFARMRAGNPSSLAPKLEKFKPDSLDDSEWVDFVEEAMESWFFSTKKMITMKQAAETTMRIPEAAALLDRLASTLETTGTLDVNGLTHLISRLEGKSKTASKNAVVGALHKLSSSLLNLNDSLLNSNPSEQRPSRLLLASTLRRILANSITAAFAPLKIRNRELGSGVRSEDFQAALLQAAENYFMCRGENRSAQTALEDALKGHFVRIGPLTGMPPAIIQRAEKVKKAAYELDHAMGEVANDYEILVRDMKRVLPEDDRYDLKDLRQAKISEEKFSRFEEGKPADPTENMNDDDAKEWEEMNAKYEGKFKTAEDHVFDQTVLSRFEEGKPADPTENMSPEDAKKWKEMNEEHRDRFKTAVGPDIKGKNWKEINNNLGRRWVWDDRKTSFHIREIPGPGIPLYTLQMMTEIDGKNIGPLKYKKPPQFKILTEAFTVAERWFHIIQNWNMGRGVGLDLTTNWMEIH